MRLHLARHSYHPICTMGWLYAGDARLATLEPPWRGNRRNQSCIPEGSYRLERYSSARFPDCFELQDVPDRSDILIHAGNWVTDTSGCILVGLEPAPNALMVMQSRAALAKLRELLAGDNDLRITIDYERG